jgi:uncharacterized membrane protein YoaK (UPF0700 family)
MKKLPSTTAMTTNVTEATVQWTHWLIGLGRRLSPDDKRDLLGRAKTVGLTVFAFPLGAIAGGVAAARVGYAGLVAPVCVLTSLALRAAFIHRKREPSGEAALGH